jgi:hypothetical protein
MLHFCVFGGSDTELRTEGGVYVTIFGGATLRRPPLAHALTLHRGQSAEKTRIHQHYCLVLFGGITVSWPTVVQEYLSLRDALRSRTITLDEWDNFVAQSGVDGSLRVNSLTLFGGFDSNETPSEDDELDTISMHRHLGQISEDAAERLMLAIGQSGPHRLAIVRQAVQAEVAGSA